VGEGGGKPGVKDSMNRTLARQDAGTGGGPGEFVIYPGRKGEKHAGWEGLESSCIELKGGHYILLTEILVWGIVCMCWNN